MCICKVDKVTNTMSISVGARMSTVAIKYTGDLIPGSSGHHLVEQLI